MPKADSVRAGLAAGSGGARCGPASESCTQVASAGSRSWSSFYCPSCMGRRMAEGAALLVDHVLPAVGYRQWVLSFPGPLAVRL